MPLRRNEAPPDVNIVNKRKTILVLISRYKSCVTIQSKCQLAFRRG